MDCIILTDDEIENNDPIEQFEQVNDELVAIRLEISEINKQINRLHRQRSHLIKQEKQLKENQQSTTKSNNHQWGQTSK